MQEEINQKTIALCIKGGKISADVLRTSLKYLLQQMQKESARQSAKRSAPPRGKQTLKDLTRQDAKLTNIQVTEKNIGSFDRVARKYAIDYALKKDKTVQPPVYYVFFRSKDVDVMTAAFREYTSDVAKRKSRPSLCARLAKALDTVRDTITPKKERNKKQERSR